MVEYSQFPSKGLLDHPRFKDVLIELHRIKYRDGEHVKAHIRWWNRGQCGKPFPLEVEERNKSIPLNFWTELFQYVPTN